MSIDCIDRERTDATAGLLTLKDDQGQAKRYVRRDPNAPLPAGSPHLTLTINNGQPPYVTQGIALDTKNLPDRLTVGLQGRPVSSPGTVSVSLGDFVAAHEYEADERAFLIWEKFRDFERESRAPDAVTIKRLLDVVDPQPARPWTVEEVKAELFKWAKDKGEA
jgi:hypothetical protein